MVVERTLSDKLLLGLELFSEGAETPDGSTTLIMNAGGAYHFAHNFSFLFSAGHSIAGQDVTVAYLGFFWSNRVKPK